MQEALTLFGTDQLTYLGLIDIINKQLREKSLNFGQILDIIEKRSKEFNLDNSITAKILECIMESRIKAGEYYNYHQVSYVLQNFGNLILSSHKILENIDKYNPDLIISIMNKEFKSFPNLPLQTKHITFNIEDNYELCTYNIYKRSINQFADLIHEYLRNKKTVIVHCFAGVSRSPTLILNYLIRHKKMNLYSAIKFLSEKRECISPNSNFLNLILDINMT